MHETMIDERLQKRLARLKHISDSTHMRAKLYGDVAKVGKGTATDGSFTHLRHVSAPGRRIQKIGFIMLWIPEPTGATIAVGAPMILAGRYLEKKYNSLTIGDIGRVTKSTLSTIKDTR